MNQFLRLSLFSIFSLFLHANSWSQECLLSCKDQVNLSLSSACNDTITPLHVLRDTSFCGSLKVELSYPGPRWDYLKPNRIDGSLRGEDIKYSVVDTVNGNSCWGILLIEDKFPPQFNCDTITISCFEELPLPDSIIENCEYSYKVVVNDPRWTAFDCDNDSLLGYYRRRIVVSDVWGNATECNQVVYVSRQSLDSMECPRDTTYDCLDSRLWNEKYVIFDEAGHAIPIPIISDNKSVGLVDPPYVVNGPDTIYLWPTGKYCQIVVKYHDHIIDACGSTYKIRREWLIKDWCENIERNCIQWITITDFIPPEPYYDDDFKRESLVFTKPHDCKAHVELTPPPVRNECSLKANPDDQSGALSRMGYRYEVSYFTHTHPEKPVSLTGEVKYGEKSTIYLPVTYFSDQHEIVWTVSDECWNDTTINQYIQVLDNTPPTPICDELTQVTLDPDSCWARVYAKDLDDGSKDNCAESLHFAVASMQDIDKWTNYWHEKLLECLGHDDYYENKHYIHELIEYWIDLYVFHDYVDLTNCITDTLVLRVYDRFDFPPYDPHVFAGSKHQWYNWFRSYYEDPHNFRCNFVLHYEDVVDYQRFYPDLDCYDLDWYISRFGGKAHEELPISNYLDICFPDDAVKQAKVDTNLVRYPILRNFANQIFNRISFEESRKYANNYFHGLIYYNDCMIEVLKDDKEPPEITAPEDITIYCDGVPVMVPVPWKDNYVLAFPQFVRNVCSGEGDYLSTVKCASPWYDFVGGRCCIELPWDTEHGYYGGPLNDHYVHHYENDPCDYTIWETDEGLKSNWRPIYCALWLWLDKFDHPRGDKYVPIYGDPEYTDNCTPFADLSLDYKDEGTLNECGVGYLSRTWTVKDQCGNEAKDYQKIQVLPRSDFEVEFPKDQVIECKDVNDLSPEKMGGEPIISDDDCELIGTNYVDQKFDIVDDACYKILRTWTIIDWCVYSPVGHGHYPDVIVDDRKVASEKRDCVYRNLKDDGDGFITYLQIIKVKDYDPPEVICNPHQDICTYDPDCEGDEITIKIGQAIDNCANAEEITYRYGIYRQGDSIPYKWGNHHTFNGYLEYGDYQTILIAYDNCGNADTCESTFSVVDCKPPTPYCYHGIATVIMPTKGSIQVWAKDLDAGSFDNCTLKENLIFSFSEDVNETSRVFSCQDIIENNSRQFSIRIYVTDEYSNQAYCETYLLIQGGTNGEICDISGISTPFDKNVDGLNILVNTSSGSQITKSSPDQSSIQELRSTSLKGDPVLFQNSPNPFTSETIISFILPNPAESTIRLIDVAGKSIHTIRKTFNQGYNELKISNQDVPKQGVIFYRLETGELLITKKMVKIN